MVLNLDKDNLIIVDPHILSIPEFKKIWDRDRSKKKENALIELSFIYHYGSMKSPYFSYPEDQKKAVLETAFKIKLDKQLEEAIAKLAELECNTTMERLLRASETAIHKTCNYLINIDYSILGENGLPIYDPNKVFATIKQSGPMLDSVNKIREQSKKGKEKGTIRGGGSVGMYED